MIVDAKTEPQEILAETEMLLFKKSSIHGAGGFAKVAIARGTRVIEYVGEKIGKAESLRRCENDNPYIFTLNDEDDLDGGVPWNPARLINHGCAPNCDAEVEHDRVWVVANRDLTPGEEITFNYNFDLEDYKEHPCCCGAANCVGYIVAEEFFEHVNRQRELASPVAASRQSAEPQA